MTLKQDSILELLAKYARCEPLSEEETLALETWRKLSRKKRFMLDVFREAEIMKAEMAADPTETAAVWSEISKGLDEMNIGKTPVVTMPPKKRYWKTAAAAILLIASAGYLCRWLSMKPQTQTIIIAGIPKILRPPPGTALYTRNDGAQIDLDTLPLGAIVETNGHDTLRKIADDYLSFNEDKDVNTRIKDMSIAVGHRSYSVRTPEGTIVHLSGGTDLSIIFDQNTRYIRLRGNGIALCSVIHDPRWPLVTNVSDSTTVDDLGTTFLVRLNSDTSKIILLDGEVRVRKAGHSIKLNDPWQAAVITNGALHRQKEEDTIGLTRWSDSASTFHFSNVPLYKALQQVAWWYKCSIVYKEKIRGRPLTGEMRKTPSLDDIVTNIRVGQRLFADVKKQGNTIIVSRWTDK